MVTATMKLKDAYSLEEERKGEGEKVEAVTDFILLGSKITADGDCNHEIKGLLLLGRKAMMAH